MSDQNELGRRLAAIRAARGYLLPHHGLLAISSPALLAAYDQAYTAMTLVPRTLSRHDHECVWLAVLVATRQPVATHHVARFHEAGGSTQTLESVLALTALAGGASAWPFVADHWQQHLPELDAPAAWLAAFRRSAGALPLRLAHLLTVAVLVSLDQWEVFAWQLCAARAEEVPETELAEALSLVMFPASVPRLVEAARIWQSLILNGQVTASADFRAWAELAGQGGYDEAVNKR